MKISKLLRVSPVVLRRKNKTILLLMAVVFCAGDFYAYYARLDYKMPRENADYSPIFEGLDKEQISFLNSDIKISGFFHLHRHPLKITENQQFKLYLYFKIPYSKLLSKEIPKGHKKRFINTGGKK